MNVTRCSTCAARIIFAVTERGKRMPVDADPHPDGNVELTPTADGGATARVVGKHERTGGLRLHRSHFASCTDPAAWRRR